MDGEDAEVDGDAAAAAAAAPSAPDGHTAAAIEVARVKKLLSEFHARESELQSTKLSLLAERDAAIARVMAECAVAMDLVSAECDTVRAEVASTEAKLVELVNAPVSGDRDPFERLPDELLAAVFLMLPLKTLLSGACELVCRRWAWVMKSAPVTRRKPEDLWGAYALGSLNRMHPVFSV
jgi:hypothetical protein